MAEIKKEKPVAKKEAAPKAEVKPAEVVKETAPKKETAKTKLSKVIEFRGTGRRKHSIARVRLLPNGNGKFVVNNKTLDEYFALGTLKLVVNQPLELTATTNKYDIFVNVHGGGLTGQSGAIRHGIARALIAAQPELRPEIKKAGYLTRDARAKERKKYGLKKARKAPQFSKR